MKVAILGAGAYGTALGQVLLENGHEVQYYDPILLKTSLEETLNGADVVVIAVPSSSVATVMQKLPENIPIIITTKGIMDANILDRFKDIMALSGPGFADDIKAHKMTLLTASDDRIVDMFTTEYLKFDRSNDARGILLCGALKNAYAVFAGLLGLKPGTPEHEKYLSDAAEEMKAILDANGAIGDTVELACGKGDLRLTCGAPSRNYEFGQMVRQNPDYRPEKTVEGVTTLGRIRSGMLIVPESAKILRNLLKRSEAWS